ncbi:MAG: ATP-binding cassette domain-containing protein [Roseburia sp.]|nr:ATP-binding cassette domain-containing protein [Anaeroplasma bactoclasticum]MCM1195874.1 ATP-binding cassette domain-containing protein [Roseburia sp.]MCM1556538.1 ATP-binding cassette domain-containing protein [Anaeroplasma bactoclasticum]
MIEVKNAKKVYTTKAEVKCAFEDVNLKFNNTGLVIILGQSGCGKTSLLNCLSGLDTLTSGSITGIKKTDASFVFQDYQLIDDLTIKENLSLAIKTTDEKINNVLKRLNLDDLPLNKKIYDLSGGQKQRVSIARALLLEKKVIFADEPTGNLDKENSILVAELLKEIAKDRLVVVVSHNEELFKKIADQIIYLDYGRIVKIEGTTYESSHKLLESNNIVHLSLKTALIISIKRIRCSIGRFIINTLLLLIIFITILLSLSFVTNSAHNSYKKTFDEMSLEWIDFFPTEETMICKKTIEDIEDETSFIENKALLTNTFYSMSKGSNFNVDIRRIHITDYFTSTKEIPTGMIAISSYLANKILDVTDYTLQDLIGMKVEIHRYSCTISEIVDINIKYNIYNRDLNESLSFIECNKATYQKIKEYYDFEIGNLGIDVCSTLHSSSSRTYDFYLDKNEQLKENEIILTRDFLSDYGLNPEEQIEKRFKIIFAGATDEYEVFVKGLDEKILVSEKIYRDLIAFKKNDRYGITVIRPSVNQIKKLESIEYMHFTHLSEQLYEMNSMMHFLFGCFGLVSILVLVILILYDLSLINNSISTKKREIGILRTIGLSIKSINILLIFDNLFAILIAFLISLAVLPGIIVYINNIFITNNICSVKYIYFNYFYALLIICVAFVLLGIYIGLCYKKLSKRTDIELVYEK